VEDSLVGIAGRSHPELKLWGRLAEQKPQEMEKSANSFLQEVFYALECQTKRFAG